MDKFFIGGKQVRKSVYDQAVDRISRGEAHSSSVQVTKQGNVQTTRLYVSWYEDLDSFSHSIRVLDFQRNMTRSMIERGGKFLLMGGYVLMDSGDDRYGCSMFYTSALCEYDYESEEFVLWHPDSSQQLPYRNAKFFISFEDHSWLNPHPVASRAGQET